MTPDQQTIESILTGLINYTAKVRGHDVPYPNAPLADLHTALNAIEQIMNGVIGEDDFNDAHDMNVKKFIALQERQLLRAEQRLALQAALRSTPNTEQF